MDKHVRQLAQSIAPKQRPAIEQNNYKNKNLNYLYYILVTYKDGRTEYFTTFSSRVDEAMKEAKQMFTNYKKIIVLSPHLQMIYSN